MDQAENLRNIIRRQSNVPKKTSRVITVTSGKGGVGKSNISVNLAISMARLGKKVVILDADFGLANVEIMLGIRPIYSLADLIFKGKDLVDIITEGPEGIGFISGGSGIQELTNMTKEQVIYLTQKLSELDELADIIIVDTGAGISDTVLEFVAASSEVILVTTPEPTSITDAYALLKTLNRRGDCSKELSGIKMVANRVSNVEEGKEIYNKLSAVVNKFLTVKLEFLGALPQDTNISKAVIKQVPITISDEGCVFSKTMEDLASVLCNLPLNNHQSKKGISQLFSNLLRSKYKGTKK